MEDKHIGRFGDHTNRLDNCTLQVYMLYYLKRSSLNAQHKTWKKINVFIYSRLKREITDTQIML